VLGPPVPALQPQRRVTELPSAQVKDPQINNAGALEHNRATVTMRGPDGTEYVVEVYRYNGRVTVARLCHRNDGER
jgi:hypothetical protein